MRSVITLLLISIFFSGCASVEAKQAIRSGEGPADPKISPLYTQAVEAYRSGDEKAINKAFARFADAFGKPSITKDFGNWLFDLTITRGGMTQDAYRMAARVMAKARQEAEMRLVTVGDFLRLPLHIQKVFWPALETLAKPRERGVSDGESLVDFQAWKNQLRELTEKPLWPSTPEGEEYVKRFSKAQDEKERQAIRAEMDEKIAQYYTPDPPPFTPNPEEQTALFLDPNQPVPPLMAEDFHIWQKALPTISSSAQRSGHSMDEMAQPQQPGFIPIPAPGFIPIPGGQALFGPITPNAYGPGLNSDATGRPFIWQPMTPGPNFSDPFLNVKPNAYGLGIGMDQYGRPVRPACPPGMLC